MRTIKFRCFDNEAKEMREVAMLRWEDGRMSRIAGYWKGTQNNGWTDYDPAEGTYELMQFTGLLDKNDKEIYEGDIVKVWDINRGCDCEDEVDGKEPVEGEHRDDCECYVTTQKIEWAPWGGYHCEEDTGEGCMPLGSDEFELEIIGNIYSNPDLLTQPKQDE